MKCNKCGNEVQDDAVFCDQCGARLSPLEAAPAVGAPATVAAAASAASPAPAGGGEARCVKCGAANLPGEMFCSECGAPLEAPAPVAASTAVPVSAVPAAPEAATAVAPAVAAAVAATAKPVSGQTRCPNCGAELDAGDSFCFACGAATIQAPAVTSAPIQPAEPATTATPEVAAAPRAGECPSCGARVAEGDPFCLFCGAALTGKGAVGSTVQPAAAVQSAPIAQPVGAVRTTVAGPRLIVEQGSDRIEIPLGEGREVTVGREDPYSSIFPDVDLTPYGAEEGGVSRRHFKLTLAEGQYAIQDLNSTNRTMLNRAPVAPGAPVRIKDGDEIRAGRIRLVFRVGA